MTIVNKNIVPAKFAEAVQTTQYTAINCKFKIDKFTATNTSAENVLFSCNLVPPSGSSGLSNLVIKNRSIAPNETYTFPELINQSLEAGGSISTLAGVASALVIAISGREIT